MRLLNGLKTISGLAVLAAGILWRAVTAHPDCEASLRAGLTEHLPEFAVGAGVVLSLLGAVHKYEKRQHGGGVP